MRWLERKNQRNKNIPAFFQNVCDFWGVFCVYVHIDTRTNPLDAMDPFFYFEDDETEPQDVVQVSENSTISSGEIQDNADMISQNTVSFGI